ncbi:MAG: hypothetical protein WD052_10085 [Bacteroidales bacterium]
MKFKNCIVKNVMAALALLLFGNISAQNARINIYPEIQNQVIKSIGANYCQATYAGHAWDAVGQATLEEFRPKYVRLALPLHFRDMDYEDYKGEKLVKHPTVISVLEAMKRMKEEYGAENFTISVWQVADALVENPGDDAQRRIKKDKYDEVIDMLEVFLLTAKNEYGVEVDYFSFNESDGGYQMIFSPEETIRFIKQAGERFRKAGLKTIFLWADTAQTKGTVEFATMIAADSTIWKFLGPLCFHSWWSENIPDSEFERIAGLAAAWEKEVWCSELGFDAMAWKIKGMNTTWDYGMRFAVISHRMMKYARVSVSLYWTWQNNYSIMSADTKVKYPSYYVTRHYTNYLNNGTRIIQSTSSDPEILAICGISPEGEQIIQVINRHKRPVTISIEGFGSVPDSIKMVTTTEKNLWKVEKRDGLSQQLDAESINTLIFR